MHHAKSITKISNVILKSDIEKHMKKIKTIPLNVYYIFRNEIIRDLEKNKEIFKK